MRSKGVFAIFLEMCFPPEGVPDGLDESDLSGTPSQHFWDNR